MIASDERQRHKCDVWLPRWSVLRVARKCRRKIFAAMGFDQSSAQCPGEIVSAKSHAAWEVGASPNQMVARALASADIM